MRSTIGMSLAALVLPALLVGAGSARADALDSLGDGPLAETSHRVHATLADELATFVVTRVIENRGDEPEGAVLDIELPPGAVATGLRIRHGGRWHAGVLLDAEIAHERYDALTSNGTPGSRGPALLAWRQTNRLRLDAFPVLPGGAVAIEYTLRAPVCDAAGHAIAAYPSAAEESLVAPAITATGGRVHDLPGFARAAGLAPPATDKSPHTSPAKSLDKLTADADDADARDGDDQLERAAEAVSDALSRCDVDWGVSDFDIARDYAYVAAPRADSGPIAIGFAATEIAGQHIAELSITAPRVIEPAPAGARIAFVVDASRSVGATGIAAQLSLIRGYLSHVPDASFEIIAYRRHAAPVFGALRGADALAELDAMIARPPARLAPGNGSHLDRGLAAAAAALARVPDGPRRIVAFTDDRLRRGFDVRAAARALRAAPGALVHVVDIGGLASDAKAFELDRDDDHRLAPLAADTGGILAHLGGGGDADAARAVALGLVRPVQIDYFEVDAVELFEGGADGVPDVLRAGDGLRALRVVDDELIRVTARGMLWNRPWKRTATVHAGRARWLPALVFGAEDWRDLDAATIAQIARVGSVVSPKTSLLARDLNARPVSFDDGAPGGVGYGTASCGCSLHNAVLRRPGGGGEPPALAPFVAGLLRERADACALIHGEPAPVQLTVETTGVEITDVRDVALASGAPADPGLAACVTEAAWDLALPAYVGDGDAIHRVVLD